MPKFLKSLLPYSLFGRALLILVVPTVLIQLSTAYFFLERHVDNVTRHMGNALAGEILFFNDLLQVTPEDKKQALIKNFSERTGISVKLERRGELGEGVSSEEYAEFQQHLAARLTQNFRFRKLEESGEVELAVQTRGGVVIYAATLKRLENRTTMLVLLTMAGASAVFLCIAVLFLRNQIRPITRLAEAAESFGRGVEVPGFRPQGAREVRRAAKAFIIMRERLKRQMAARTQMLNGISHDLRTPLTRMKLELAMLPDTEQTRELGEDVEQMQQMLQEYLDFARGEAREEPVETDLSALLQEIIGDYQRTGAAIQIVENNPCKAWLRPPDIRRVVQNIVDNALRYGTKAEISLHKTGQHAEIMVDDNGPGVPPEQRLEIFRPFTRLDPSRNLQTGGVGLGLAIARDITLAHGGSILLKEAPAGGARVMVRLPL